MIVETKTMVLATVKKSHVFRVVEERGMVENPESLPVVQKSYLILVMVTTMEKKVIVERGWV
jgi:hypothetical protein